MECHTKEWVLAGGLTIAILSTATISWTLTTTLAIISLTLLGIYHLRKGGKG